MSGGPLQFQEQHLFISHATGPAKHGFDGGVDRLHHAEADPVIAVGGDAVDVLQQEVAQSFHLGQALPAPGLEPPHQEIEDVGPRLIGPQPIELLAEHVGFEQAPIHGEQRLELGTLRSAHRLPPPQQQPSFPATVCPHDRPGPKEFLPSDFVKRRAGGLQHVKLVVDDLGVRQDLADHIDVGAVHVCADGLDGRPLPGVPALVQQRCPLPRWISSTPRCRGRRFGRVRSHSARNAFSARRAFPQLTPCRTAA